MTMCTSTTSGASRRFSRRHAIQIGGMFGLGSLFVACGGSSSTPTSAPASTSLATSAGSSATPSVASAAATPAQTAKPASGGTLNFGLATDANSLDPREGSAQESN